ncbi:hypothetical protein RvY_11795 [Ramazzottius varieornatus]|uniref:Uncharacterized protein n=1 Tax=Ramazzottius varieornatus TaxID=947166 RepID=A0A1D1VMN8_RAMVA|nr:hypothetical protein RvY_11795 [Ramazzottius varieornatus]
MPAGRLAKKPQIVVPKSFLQVAQNSMTMPERTRKPVDKKISKGAKTAKKITPVPRSPRVPRKSPKRNGGIKKKKVAVKNVATTNPNVKKPLHKGANFSSYEDFVNALYKYQRETNTVFKTVKKNYLPKEDPLRRTLRYADHTYQCGNVRTVTTAGPTETAQVKSKPCMAKIEVRARKKDGVLSVTRMDKLSDHKHPRMANVDEAEQAAIIENERKDKIRDVSRKIEDKLNTLTGERFKNELKEYESLTDRLVDKISSTTVKLNAKESLTKDIPLVNKESGEKEPALTSSNVQVKASASKTAIDTPPAKRAKPEATTKDKKEDSPPAGGRKRQNAAKK